MKKIGNVLILVGAVVIALPIAVIIFSGILGFFLGCSVGVAGSSTCTSINNLMFWAAYGVLRFGIYYVGLPALVIGFILKSIGGEKTQQTNFEVKSLDTSVSSLGSMLKTIILLGLAAIFWWITVPLFIFFTLKYKSVHLGYERFKKFIFGQE